MDKIVGLENEFKNIFNPQAYRFPVIDHAALARDGARGSSRTKIGNDPNNTTWAHDDSTYGSKILRAQGWTPGNYLGPEDAAHAAYLTSASASHIRVVLREDNLGLGAKRGAEGVENFGLRGLQSLFGRLNGKSDALTAKEEEAQAKLNRSARYLQLGFVRGGYLLGEDKEDQAEVDNEETAQTVDSKKDKKKRSNDDGEGRPSKRVKRTTVPTEDGTSGEKAATIDKGEGKEGKESKEQRRLRKLAKRAKKDAKRSKEDRRRRKEERRARKEARRARRSERSTTPSSSDTAEKSSASTTPEREVAASRVVERGTGGRHAARQRFIRSKSGMSAQAMREILMIKS